MKYLRGGRTGCFQCTCNIGGADGDVATSLFGKEKIIMKFCIVLAYVDKMCPNTCRRGITCFWI